MANIASDIIAALGGDTQVHRATGLPISTINSWKLGEKPNIPSWRRGALLELALREEKSLTPAMREYLTSPREDAAA